jgi:hypothetical protein
MAQQWKNHVHEMDCAELARPVGFGHMVSISPESKTAEFDWCAENCGKFERDWLCGGGSAHFGTFAFKCNEMASLFKTMF